MEITVVPYPFLSVKEVWGNKDFCLHNLLLIRPEWCQRVSNGDWGLLSMPSGNKHSPMNRGLGKEDWNYFT